MYLRLHHELTPRVLQLVGVAGLLSDVSVFQIW